MPVTELKSPSIPPVVWIITAPVPFRSLALVAETGVKPLTLSTEPLPRLASDAVSIGPVPPSVTSSVPLTVEFPVVATCDVLSSCAVAPVSTSRLAALKVPFCVRCKMPASTSAAPILLPVLESDRVPVPVFVTPPAPVIVPSNAVSLLFCAVRVPVPSVTAPAPVKSCAVWLKLFNASVAPEATFTAELVANALAMPVVSVPASMSVLPVKVLVLDSVRFPAPSLVSDVPSHVVPLAVSSPSATSTSNASPASARVKLPVACDVPDVHASSLPRL